MKDTLPDTIVPGQLIYVTMPHPKTHVTTLYYARVAFISRCRRYLSVKVIDKHTHNAHTYFVLPRQCSSRNDLQVKPEVA